MNFFLLILYIISCKKKQESDNCVDPSKINLNQPCIEIYQPVCGCNLKTYSNFCFAQINRINEWTDGKCNND